MNNLSAPLDAKQRMCEKCMALLDETLGIVRNGRFFHENCFTCSACHKILTDDYQFSATSDSKGVRSSSSAKSSLFVAMDTLSEVFTVAHAMSRIKSAAFPAGGKLSER